MHNLACVCVYERETQFSWALHPKTTADPSPHVQMTTVCWHKKEKRMTREAQKELPWWTFKSQNHPSMSSGLFSWAMTRREWKGGATLTFYNHVPQWSRLSKSQTKTQSHTQTHSVFNSNGLIYVMRWCLSCWSVESDRSRRVSNIFIVHSIFTLIIMLLWKTTQHTLDSLWYCHVWWGRRPEEERMWTQMQTQRCRRMFNKKRAFIVGCKKHQNKRRSETVKN